MTARSRPTSRAGAIRLDLWRLYERWMELCFRRNDDAPAVRAPVPNTAVGRLAYGSWAVLGALVVAGLYPLVTIGFGLRPWARRAERVAGFEPGAACGGRTAMVLLAYPALAIAVGLAIASGLTAVPGPHPTGLLGAEIDRGGFVSVMGLAIPVGWTVGCAVRLADLVRPARRKKT
ncbi:hypothetical protein [Halalkalicoccus subterraneus]|uniref:hypothetical protein n=1 Tax=Halalkalicoccus subterraneus TaxID=2675002 RepID=UPI000EFBA67D|nr:hypothetical protein [Halalkalicoccus subterraneus]